MRKNEITEKIRNYGEMVKPSEDKIYKVPCAICGRSMYSTDNPDDMEFVETKRGTRRFFHTACQKKQPGLLPLTPPDPPIPRTLAMYHGAQMRIIALDDLARLFGLGGLTEIVIVNGNQTELFRMED